MASKHEMISPQASVPIGISSRNDMDIVRDSFPYWAKIMRVMYIDESDHHCYTKRKEKYMCFLRFSCSELLIHLNGMDEISLHGVYALARSIVEYWRLPFFVHEYLELSFHFQVTPVIAILQR